ncbi:hypothetical protein F5B22DRAFT_408685 [Xylaria bambusicola]|uniref:uncharacterized protein n=1 Tax=Xylaria bambusicola TaxID=326684 RepID=UPI0020086CD8|nr:uncharacterized protein F5B22DRAFT_408685 [Xylaria bambusicola]KAI0523674.1 hypothetical protein F5B22DRAFT_408685 [Xylaria bambusicola]
MYGATAVHLVRVDGLPIVPAAPASRIGICIYMYPLGAWGLSRRANSPFPGPPLSSPIPRIAWAAPPCLMLCHNVLYRPCTFHSPSSSRSLHSASCTLRTTYFVLLQHTACLVPAATASVSALVSASGRWLPTGIHDSTRYHKHQPLCTYVLCLYLSLYLVLVLVLVRTPVPLLHQVPY